MFDSDIDGQNTFVCVLLLNLKSEPCVYGDVDVGVTPSYAYF